MERGGPVSPPTHGLSSLWASYAGSFRCSIPAQGALPLLLPLPGALTPDPHAALPPPLPLFGSLQTWHLLTFAS